MNDRPNILWLTYEDTSPQFVSCYGMTPVQTSPRIDELAARGVRFDNVFATAPVCSASRSALITGVCNEATGLGHHRSRIQIPRERIKGFPRYLREAGYYTSNNEKTDYNIHGESDFIAETWDESSSTAHWRGRADDQPFFSVFNFMDSHQTRTMTRPYRWYEEQVLESLPEDAPISPDQIDVPPVFKDDDEMRRYLSRVYNSIRLCDLRIGERLDELSADGLSDSTIVFCFADHGEGIPRGKCNGIGFGYRAAFVAYFPEAYKHLNPWGSCVITSELVSFEDLAPTMLSLAGLTPPDHMTGRILAGPSRQSAPEYIYAARNRLDDTPDLARSTMDGTFVYTRNYFPHLPVMKYQKFADVSDIMRAIRRDSDAGVLTEIQQEMVQPTRPTEYLFDLHADPWEINNLASDTAYAEDLLRLRTETIRHAREVGDVHFLPEHEMVARARDTSPYERRFDVDYNPLDQLLEVADLVGRPNSVNQLVDTLTHDDAAVRYWAGVGLFAAVRLRQAGIPGWESIERIDIARVSAALLDNPSFVLVEVAAALIGLGVRSPQDHEGAHPDPWHVLAGAIEDDDPLLAHQAIEKLLYLPSVAPEFATSVDKAAQKIEGKSLARASLFFPVSQAIDMYHYLFDDAALYYEDDLPYL